jgi:hypothetical protein
MEHTTPQIRYPVWILSATWDAIDSFVRCALWTVYQYTEFINNTL